MRLQSTEVGRPPQSGLKLCLTFRFLDEECEKMPKNRKNQCYVY